MLNIPGTNPQEELLMKTHNFGFRFSFLFFFFFFNRAFPENYGTVKKAVGG